MVTTQNLKYENVGNTRETLRDMLKLMDCLNPYTADVDYVIGLYNMIIEGDFSLVV